MGIDLLDYFRARRPWTQLLRLAEQLPDHSHYKVAIHNDDELARRRAEADDRSGRTRPRRSGVDAHTWTPERAALTDVADILLRVIALLQTQVSGKRTKPAKPMPRPVYAADRIEQNDTIRRHRERVAAMLPTQGGG